MLRFRIPAWLRVSAIALTMIAFAPDASFAVPDDPPPPKPRPSCNIRPYASRITEPPP